MARAIAEIDALCAFAAIAVARDWRRPQFVDEAAIEIDAGRHPVVESQVDPFIANDTRLAPTRQLLLITGPNMGGKSTYMRQVALIVLMAHAGAFVPAKAARLGPVDQVFTRIGAADDLAGGRSTFMVEMTESANILHNATAQSLVLMDEVGRGTSTSDGLSIARAIMEFLVDPEGPRPRTLFATHFHELTELQKLLPGVENRTFAVREWKGEVIFLYKVIPGAADDSYGIHVAKLAGLPRAVSW